MKGPGFRLSVRASAAAIGSALALGAAAQMPADQVQASLDRAVRAPTEVIWLRDEILADLWRNTGPLAGGNTICAKPGDTRLGCTIGERPAWRYVAGGASPADPRFLARTSGVYIVAPQAQRAGLVRAPSGEILLAAGMSVQLIDAAYPGIQIELSAPADRALPLGNLARADGGRLFGLLARKPGMVSASAAAVIDGNRVALTTPASDIQFAAARPTEIVAAVARPVVAPVVTPVIPVVVASAAPAVVAPSIPAPLPLKLAAEIRPAATPAAQDETTQQLALAEAALAQAFVARARAYTPPAVAEVTIVALAPIPAPAPAPVVAAAPEPAPVQPAVVAAVEVPGHAIEPAPVVAAVIVPPTAAPVQPVEPPVVIAAVAPAAPAAPEVKAGVAEAHATDLARLRAEVEAEIERDRVRLASAQQQACGGILRPGQGCSIGTPRRFTFSG